MRRGIMLIAAVTALVSALAVPALATKPPAPGAQPADGHKITICHATRSLDNPYVEITIDVAAWNDPSDPRHHGDHHTRTKDGVTWSDYVLKEGESCVGPTTTSTSTSTTSTSTTSTSTTTTSTTTTTQPPPSYSCAGTDVPILIDTSSAKLWDADGRRTDLFMGLDIPAGTYSVTLGSWDDDHPDGPTQLNEQWRAMFYSDGTPVASGYAADLADDAGTSKDTAVATDAGIVTIGHTTELITEHWSIEMESLSPDSVYPLCVGLTPVED